MDERKKSAHWFRGKRPPKEMEPTLVKTMEDICNDLAKIKIDENRDTLVDEIEDCDLNLIVDTLQQGSHISRSQAENVIHSIPTRHQRVETLLDIIRVKSPSVYRVFTKAVGDTGQASLYKLLWDQSINLPEKPPTSKTSFQRFQEKFADHQKVKIQQLKTSYLKSTKYVPLQINKKLVKPEVDNRSSYREYRISSKQVAPIDLTDLFKKQGDSEPPRSVLLLGAPGSGKTHSCVHLVEKAVKREWKFPDSVPFFIRLRELQNNVMSLQDFLLGCHGPTGCNTRECFESMVENEERIWLILDGIDECSFDFMNDQVTTLTDPLMAITQDSLLKSLVKGDLLGKAKLLLTSRLYKLDNLWEDVDRKVEISGLEEEQIISLIKEELRDNKALPEALNGHQDVLSLCSIPINAIGLIKYFQYSPNQGTDLFPHSKTEFCIKILESFLMEKLRPSRITRAHEVMKKNSAFLRKLCKMCADSFIDARIKFLFTQDEIEIYGIREDDLQTGLLTAHFAIYESMHGEELDKLFNVPHLVSQELMAATHQTQADIAAIKDMVVRNRGQLDFVLISLVGLLGNSRCHDFLNVIFPEGYKKNYAKKARVIMKCLITSPRRYLPGGEMFLLDALRESCQWQLTANVQAVLGDDLDFTRWIKSPDEWSVVSEYVSRVAHPKLKWLPGALCDDPESMEKAANKCDYIAIEGPMKLETLHMITSKSSHVKRFAVVGIPVVQSGKCHLWFPLGAELKAVGLENALINRQTLPTVCNSLTKLTQLEQLSLSFNSIGHGGCSTTSCLSCLRQLKQLSSLLFWDCNLGPRDVTQLFTMGGGQLKYIDMTSNPHITDDELTAVCHQLSRRDCRLVSLSMIDCGITGSMWNKLIQTINGHPSLTSLNVGRNNIGREFGQTALNPSIQRLCVSGCGISCHDASAALTSHQCLHVDLSNNDISQGSNQLMQVLVKPNKLTHVRLANCNLQDNDLYPLPSVLTQASSISVLDIASNAKLSCALLTELCTRGALEVLNISDCKLSASEWRSISQAVTASSTLQEVYIGDSGVVSSDHMVPCVKGFGRPMKAVYIWVDPSQRAALADALHEREEALSAPGMFIMHITYPPDLVYRRYLDVPNPVYMTLW